MLIFASREESKDQEAIQLSTTPDRVTTWECDKTTSIHNTQLRGQPFPITRLQGTDKIG